MSTYSAKTSSGAKWFDEDDNKEENKDVAPKKEKKESEAISPPHWTHDSRTKKDKRGQLIQLSDHALKMQTDSARVMLCERGYGDMSHRKIASAQFNLRDIPVVYLNEKEPDASWHDLYTTSGSHKVRNGRMKFAIWAQPFGFAMASLLLAALLYSSAAAQSNPEAPSPLLQQSTKPPNFVVYLVDDLGFWNVHFGGDLSPHNPDINSPTFAKLAGEGSAWR